MDAASLIGEMVREMAPVEKTLKGHAYPARAAEGKIGKDSLQRFAGEQFHILRSDLRSVAVLVARFGAGPARDFFWNTLQGEKAAFEALKALGAALGVTERGLEDCEPSARGHAYTAYMAWLGAYGGQAEVAAAFLVNFPAWGYNCGRMSSALKSRYGLKDDAVAFFDLFASSPPGFEVGAAAVVAAGLASGENPRDIKRAARLLQAYELMFWDEMLDGSLAQFPGGTGADTSGSISGVVRPGTGRLRPTEPADPGKACGPQGEKGGISWGSRTPISIPRGDTRAR